MPITSVHAKSAGATEPRPIAALFVSGRSIYKHLPGVTAYDAAADALSFDAMTPAVVHPPCRLWSKYLAHQAKPLDPSKERTLGFFAVLTVQMCGGVLEQPAGSALWAAAHLPPIGHADHFGFSLYVEQWWFGHASRKPTWLYICGVPRHQVQPPAFRFDAPPADADYAEARSRTCPAFAHWLCQIARLAQP